MKDTQEKIFNEVNKSKTPLIEIINKFSEEFTMYQKHKILLSMRDIARKKLKQF